MSNINIFIYTHKDFKPSVSNDRYKILSGIELKNNYDLDIYNTHTGDNLGDLEYCYSEVEGLYWIWKNINVNDLPDFIGLNHYRTYFSFLDNIPEISENEIILPNPMSVANMSNIRMQYQCCHNIKDWEICEQIIEEKYPEYMRALNITNNLSVMCHRNCFIMSKANFIKYMEWLFDILQTFDSIRGFKTIDDVKKHVNEHINEYKKYDQKLEFQYRIEGFLAERLFNIFIIQNFKSDNIKMYDYIMTEENGRWTSGHKKYFISFANSDGPYGTKRIMREADDTKIFDETIAYSEKDFDADFKAQCGNRFENYKRGYGYWSWKPYVIKKTLEKMNDNDILVYADAGCQIKKENAGKLLCCFRYTELSECGIYMPSIREYMEHQWTKYDLYDYINKIYNPERWIIFENTAQIMATVIYIRKCKGSMDLIDKWLDTMVNHFDLVNDSPSKLPNHPDFIENRHDQSVFSLLCKLADGALLDNAFGQYGIDNKEAPIYAARIKKGLDEMIWN